MGNPNHPSFYDKRYAENPDLFSKPLEGPITQFAELVEGKRVLDIGAGSGRHALLLAEHGARVLALDTSTEGLKLIEQNAQERGLTIQTKVFNVQEDKLPENYDGALCTFLFHHLSQQEADQLIRDMQDSVSPGGYNAIACFLNEGFIFDNQKQRGAFPYSEELRKKYEDANWTVLAYEETWRKTAVRMPSGGPGQNKVGMLLAQKPS